MGNQSKKMKFLVILCLFAMIMATIDGRAYTRSICVWDKATHGATDEWCKEAYETTNQCRGNGCKLESTQTDADDTYRGFNYGGGYLAGIVLEGPITGTITGSDIEDYY